MRCIPHTACLFITMKSEKYWILCEIIGSHGGQDLQSWRRGQYVSPKLRYLPTRVHGAATQNNIDGHLVNFCILFMAYLKVLPLT